MENFYQCLVTELLMGYFINLSQLQKFQMQEFNKYFLIMNQQQLKNNYPYVYKFFSDIPECVFWDFLREEGLLLDALIEKIFQFVDSLATKVMLKEKFKNVKIDQESFRDFFAEILVAYIFKNYYPEFIQATSTPKPDLRVEIHGMPIYIEVTRASAERSAKEMETESRQSQNEGEILEVTDPKQGTFKNFLDKLHGKVRQFSDINEHALKLIALVSDRGFTTDLSYFYDKKRREDIEEDSNFQTIDGLLIIANCKK